MKRLLTVLSVLAALPAAAAATLLAIPEGGRIAVRAEPGEIAAIDLESLQPLWTVAGVRNPRVLVLSTDGRWAAAFDSISNELALVDLAKRTSRFEPLPDTPLASVFLDGALFVISREARLLSRIDPEGSPTRTAPLPPGASLMVAGGDGLIVYSPLTGAVERFEPSTLRSAARAQLPRFGSDLEADGRSGYLVLPRAGQVAAFSLDTLALDHLRAAGAVPTDLAVETPANAVRAARIAIADPSSKRVWRDDGAQSTAAAFGRGFLRGLLGLGIYTPRSSAFPSGVDRIVASGALLLAFDSSSGTLFAVKGDRATAVATGVAWGSFAVAGGDLLVARGGDIERHPLP